MEPETTEAFQIKGNKTSIQLEISYFILKHIQINKYWKT